MSDGTDTCTFTPGVVEGVTIVPGVKPGMVALAGIVVVVLVVVVDDAAVAASGSPTAGVSRACGVLTTFTESAYSGSVTSMTTARLENTFVTLPTSPAAFNTGMPTLMPLSLPWLISTVCE